jgi:hypothetical protein
VEYDLPDLIAPNFFGGSVNALIFAKMLEVWLIPQLREKGLMADDVTF